MLVTIESSPPLCQYTYRLTVFTVYWITLRDAIWSNLHIVLFVLYSTEASLILYLPHTHKRALPLLSQKSLTGLAKFQPGQSINATAKRRLRVYLSH